MVIPLHGLHPWLSNATAPQFKTIHISRTALDAVLIACRAINDHRVVCVAFSSSKKWELPLSGLTVVRYSDNCGRAKSDPDLHEEFAK